MKRIKKEEIEKRRKQIAGSASKARKELADGKLVPMSAKEIIRKLQNE